MTTSSRAAVRCLQGERSGHGASSSGEVFTMQRSRHCRKARSGFWGDLRFLLGLGLDCRSLVVYQLMISPMVRAPSKKGPRPLSNSVKGLGFSAGTKKGWRSRAKFNLGQQEASLKRGGGGHGCLGPSISERASGLALRATEWSALWTIRSSVQFRLRPLAKISLEDTNSGANICTD